MHSFRAIMALAVGVGLLAAGPVTPVTAQNATEAGNLTSGDLEAPPGFEFQLEQGVRLNDWSYSESSEEFTVSMTLDRPVQVNMAEAVNPEEAGVVRANVRSELMRPGKHTVRFAAEIGPNGEAAMTVSSPGSVDAGQVAYISTGSVPQDLPMQRTGPLAGWFGGISVMLVMTVAAGVHKIRHTHKAPQEP